MQRYIICPDFLDYSESYSLGNEYSSHLGMNIIHWGMNTLRYNRLNVNVLGAKFPIYLLTTVLRYK